MTRIVLLDDHAILRDGIKHLLENEGDLSVVAECERLMSEALPAFGRFDCLVNSAARFETKEWELP